MTMAAIRIALAGSFWALAFVCLVYMAVMVRAITHILAAQIQAGEKGKATIHQGVFHYAAALFATLGFFIFPW